MVSIRGSDQVLEYKSKCFHWNIKDKMKTYFHLGDLFFQLKRKLNAPIVTLSLIVSIRALTQILQFYIDHSNFILIYNSFSYTRTFVGDSWGE